jgi:hypothetical protein
MDEYGLEQRIRAGLAGTPDGGPRTNLAAG